MNFKILRSGRPTAVELHVGQDVDQYNTGWHFHHGLQLVHVTDGKRMFEWRRGSATATKGQTLILPPGLVHRGCSTSRPASFIMLYVSEHRSPEPQQLMVPTFTRDRIVAEAMVRAGHEGQLVGTNEIIARLYAGVLTPPKTCDPASVPGSVLHAKAWLEKHSECPDCFEQLGKACGYNPFYMSRLFSYWTGLSPRAFRLQIRLLGARTMISDGWPIAQAAAEFGFADQSHLGRHFKRAFGLQPSWFAPSSRSS